MAKVVYFFVSQKFLWENNVKLRCMQLLDKSIGWCFSFCRVAGKRYICSRN
jgi:hypothetical protein